MGLKGIWAGVSVLRILVFPHILTYVDPQEREHDLTHVELKSSGTCTPSNLKFAFEDVTQTITVNCTAPITVVREQGLRSFTYAGSLRIQRGTELPPHLEVINDVGMEDYLLGVIPGEMPQSWPLETLKAQAVAARTYALWELARARRERPLGSKVDPGYDFDDTVQYQAYIGATEPPLPATSQALAQTQGQVLVTPDGLPIRAYFHADSGGHTEDAANAIPDVPAPYCVGKPEIYDASHAPGPWTRSFAAADFTRLLATAKLIPADAVVVRAQVDEATRFASGRAKQVWITLSTGSEVAIDALELRHALGLRSTLFQLKESPDGWNFDGRGSGHGVGMSQWGAKLLSDQLNWDYVKILDFYYTGVKLDH
jgi:stage II sporulation protein D